MAVRGEGHKAEGLEGLGGATEAPTASHFRMISGPPWREGSARSARTAAAGTGVRLPLGLWRAQGMTWDARSRELQGPRTRRLNEMKF